jgi:hypothetical protein
VEVCEERFYASATAAMRLWSSGLHIEVRKFVAVSLLQWHPQFGHIFVQENGCKVTFIRADFLEACRSAASDWTKGITTVWINNFLFEDDSFHFEMQTAR